MLVREDSLHPPVPIIATLAPTTVYALRKLLRRNLDHLRSIVVTGAAIEADPTSDLNAVLTSLYLEPAEIEAAAQQLEHLMRSHDVMSAQGGKFHQQLRQLEEQIFWVLGYKYQSEVLRGHLLWVEESVEESVISHLQREGFHVEVAHTLHQARQKMHEQLPDLLLLATQHMDGQGYDFCQQLKASSAWREIPVLFLMPTIAEDEKVHAFEVGGADILLKPLHFQELLARLNHQLHLHQLQHRLEEQNIRLKKEIYDRRQVESRYQAIVENSIQGMFQSSLDGDYVMVNPALAKLYGYDSIEDLLIHLPNVRSLYVQPSRRDEFVAYMQRFQTVVDFESQVYRRDGSKIWISETVRSVQDGNGNFLFFEGSVHDITARKRAEEWLHLQYQVNQTLTKGISLRDAAQVLLSTLGDCIEWRLGELWLLDHRRNELHCACTWQQIAGESIAFLTQAKEFGFKPGESFPGLVWRHGEPIWVADITKLTTLNRMEAALESNLHSAIGFPLKQGDRFFGILAFYHRQIVELEDGLMNGLATIASQFAQFIERYQAEQALRRSEAQLRQKTQQLEAALQKDQTTQMQMQQQEKLSSLGRLVAGIAQEVHDPLGKISGNLSHAEDSLQDLVAIVRLYRRHTQGIVALEEADALDLDFLLEDFPKLVTSIATETERIHHLIQALQEFSDPQQMGNQSMDLSEGITRALLLLKHRLQATAQRPEITVLQYFPNLPRVTCDPSRLNQVWMHLLNNAIDAIDQRWSTMAQPISQMPCIRLTGTADEHQVILHVIDNGSGIAPADLPKIYEPFFTTKPSGQGLGLGLGLSLVYQIIVECHQGQIQCQSTPGEKTIVSLTLPILPELEMGS
ncbi:MAG: ATP-binding protein [Synechococcales bacterium]|nr:ATP-binding protein [Synechococcales bacterium]